MIRNAQLFFKAVSYGFLMPALVVGTAIYWASDRSPLPVPFDGGDAVEPPSLAASGVPDAESRSQPQSSAPAPVVAIVSSNFGHASGTELATRIQTQLRRLGCLQGAVDGTWNTATAAAARTFVEDRRLGIPHDAPGSLLLLLLEADSSTRCIGPKPAAVSAEVPTSTPRTAGAGHVDATGSVMPAASADTADTGVQPDVPKPAPPPRRGSAGMPNQQSTFSGLNSSAP